MSLIHVTVTTAFLYDTEDGPVTNDEQAREDVWSMLANGDLSANDFTITIGEPQKPAQLFVEFSAGRRGVNHPECKWCGAAIHHGLDDGRIVWLDGHLDRRCDTPLGAPEREHEEAVEQGPRLGPFEQEYLDVTYTTLRYEGETIAYFDTARGDWIITEGREGAGEAYSDMTIQIGRG